MSDIAILVENLSKCYRIGKREKYYTLRDQIVNTFAAPFQYLSTVVKNPRGYAGKPTDDEIFWALKDVSFDVRQGEVLGIIGRNGAGKSTLLKILSRITHPTNGSVDLFGRVGSLLEVGTGFHAELTGRENIYLNGAILGMKKTEIERKFDEIIAFAEVEKFLDTPVKHYSSGMYMRLAFAVAAHLEPEILLVDEVLAVGDAAFQKKCLGRMSEVAQQGRTILFVSHNMEAVERLCRNVLWVDHGKIYESGLAGDVVNSYMNTRLSAQKASLAWGNRPGSKKIKFMEMKIIRCKVNQESHELYTGDAMSFVLQLEADDDYVHAYIGIQLIDSRANLVFAFHSQERGFDLRVKEGLNEVILEIPFLPLLGGIYSVNLTMRLPDKSLADDIQGADTFNITPADIYSSGFPFLSQHGKVFIEHTWKIVDL